MSKNTIVHGKLLINETSKSDLKEKMSLFILGCEGIAVSNVLIQMSWKLKLRLLLRSLPGLHAEHEPCKSILSSLTAFTWLTVAAADSPVTSTDLLAGVGSGDAVFQVSGHIWRSCGSCGFCRLRCVPRAGVTSGGCGPCPPRTGSPEAAAPAGLSVELWFL